MFDSAGEVGYPAYRQMFNHAGGSFGHGAGFGRSVFVLHNQGKSVKSHTGTDNCADVLRVGYLIQNQNMAVGAVAGHNADIFQRVVFQFPDISGDALMNGFTGQNAVNFFSVNDINQTGRPAVFRAEAA